jgi:hypothetical protein
MRHKGREVVYVQRGDSSAKWLFWGAVLGAGLALMYAPRSGEETRRGLQRRLWKLRAMTEEKMDELVEHHVVRDIGRHLDEAPVELDRATRRTGAPSGALVANGDARRAQAGVLRQFETAWRELRGCESPEVRLHGGPNVGCPRQGHLPVSPRGRSPGERERSADAAVPDRRAVTPGDDRGQASPLGGNPCDL